MIRGYFERPGHEAIPDENIDEPIEFYTKDIPTMESKLLKKGTVVMATHRTSTEVAEQGTISAVDNEDNRTMFPYFVDFKTSSAWVKESDIKEVIPHDNAPSFILGVAMVIAFFYCALTSCCGGCNVHTKQPTPTYIDSPLNGGNGRIPDNNLSDTI